MKFQFQHAVLWFTCLLVGRAHAQNLKLPSFFSDNMVLQREAKNPFWGWATPGEKITVSLQDHTQKTVADRDGKWRVDLAPPPVGGPYQIAVTGQKTIVLNNVLCGDVWICSGQSNMALTLHETTDGAPQAEMANDPFLRHFKADLRPSLGQNDVVGGWNETTPAPARYFSAVGYFFGKKLRQELQIPIGLITTAWGGTQIEAWMNPESLRQDPDWPAIATREAKAAEGPNHSLENVSGALFRSLTVPLAPLAIRGVAWYQGESNFGRGYQYRRLFPQMIKDWRALWARPNLPFVWVQIPNIGPTPAEPTGSGWAETREAQTMALRLPNTAMATTIDVGDANDIHPKFKRPFGERLALAALQKIYGQKIVGLGPLFQSFTVENGAIRLHFAEIGGDLEVRGGGPLRGFAIAGEDRKWVWAEAKIEGADVVVSSPQVAKPVAARYGWADTPILNLQNREGLPATPFRTDDWPEWTRDNK